MTTKEVGSLVFDVGRLDGPTYINIIENHLLSYIEKSVKQNGRWYYVQGNSPCHKSAFVTK